MAKERGWWKLETTVEPSEADREHIAGKIDEGYTEGEIARDEEEEEDNMTEEPAQVSKECCAENMKPFVDGMTQDTLGERCMVCGYTRWH